ncbi:MAG: Hpt domain-containing protein, partial [Thermodesulfovibrionales bacterium]
MEEIIGEFITEAEEALDRVDPLFVELEQKGYDRDLLNDIFRSIHTLKGAAGFLGFQKIVDVAHGAESILKKLRDGEIGLRTSHIDIILESVDMLRLLISHIKNKDGVEEETSDLVGRLNSALNKEDTEEKEQDIVSMNYSREGVAEKPIINTPKQESITDASTVEKTLPDKKESIQTLRIDVDRVDKVMNLTGEIVLIRNRLLNIATSLDSRYPGDESV